MPKRVRGYLAKDGTYFNSKFEAAYHESENALADAIAEKGYSEDVLEFIVTFHMLVEQFIKDLKAKKHEERQVRNSTNAD